MVSLQALGHDDTMENAGTLVHSLISILQVLSCLHPLAFQIFINAHAKPSYLIGTLGKLYPFESKQGHLVRQLLNKVSCVKTEREETPPLIYYFILLELPADLCVCITIHTLQHFSDGNTNALARRRHPIPTPRHVASWYVVITGDWHFGLRRPRKNKLRPNLRVVTTFD